MGEGFAIVKLEADKGDIVSEFNSYMQRKEGSPSFVSGSEGYFRLHCDPAAASSVAVVEFGHFLQSCGYSINGISTASTREGEEGTAFSFSKSGMQGTAVVSTKNVY